MMREWMLLAGLAVAASAVRAGGGLRLPEGDEVFSGVAFESSWTSPDSGLRRTCWDFERAIDLSGGKAVTFEYRYDNQSAVTMLNVYFRTGSAANPTGWYVCNFGPNRPGWNRATFGGDKMKANRRNFRLVGKPDGWDRITALRFSAWGPGPETTKFEIRGFRTLAPGEKPANPERRLMWMPCAGWEDSWDWDKTAAFCRKCGMTDVIARTTQIGSACYPSDHTPSDARILSEHGDQLKQAVDACRRENLKFHAWIISWQVRGTQDYIDRMRKENRLQFPEPDAAAKASGWVWPWLCPSDPRNVGLETDLAEELAARGADGVHLDYIRHNGRRGCYCDRCRGKFEARLGRKVANWPKDVEQNGCDVGPWDAFRRDCVTALVRSVRDRLRTKFPKVELSAAVQAYPEHVHCAQDWPAWCKAKTVDFVCPMDYHSSTCFLTADLKRQRPVMDGSGVPIYPGIGVAGAGLSLNEWQTARQIDLVREEGFPGYTFFWLLKGNARVFERLAAGGPLSE